MKQSLRKTISVVAALSALTVGVQQASASILIYDDFNRTGALNGSSPNIGGGTWTSSANNHTTTDNGGQVIGGWNAALPFTPEAGKEYKLTLTVGPVLDQALIWGFANHTGGFGDWDYLGQDVANMTWAQIGIWQATGYPIQQHNYYGTNIGGTTTPPAVTYTLDAGMGNGYVNTLDLFLDTTLGLDSAVMTLKINNTQKGQWSGNVTGYNSIVFGRGTDGPYNTQITDLTLQAIPEPTTGLIFFLGSVALGLWRRTMRG